jgi:hypothetical protein
MHYTTESSYIIPISWAGTSPDFALKHTLPTKGNPKWLTLPRHSGFQATKSHEWAIAALKHIRSAIANR